MGKRVFKIAILFVFACSMSACGFDIPEAMDYANEQYTQMPQETTTDYSSLNLESAITGALEEEGVGIVNDEGTLCFDVPEGYIYDEVNELYISMDSTANIRIENYAKDGKVMYASKEAMELAMEERLSEKNGYDIDVIVSDTEEITIGGYEGACFTYEYTLEGNEIVNKQILIIGDKNDHALAFLYYSDSPHADDWDAIKESVRFE